MWKFLFKSKKNKGRESSRKRKSTSKDRKYSIEEKVDDETNKANGETNKTEDKNNERNDETKEENVEDNQKLCSICSKSCNFKFAMCCDKCKKWFHEYNAGILRKKNTLFETDLLFPNEVLCSNCNKGFPTDLEKKGTPEQLDKFSKEIKTLNHSTDSITIFPNEILLKIFNLLLRRNEENNYFIRNINAQQLSQLASVCGRWQQLSYQTDFAKSFDFKFIDLRNLDIDASIIGEFLFRGTEDLLLCGTKIIGNDIWLSRLVGPWWLCNLQVMMFFENECDMVILEDILSLCINLKKLFLNGNEIKDHFYDYIAFNKDLEVFCLMGAKNVTSGGLIKVLRKCPNISVLRLAETRLIGDWYLVCENLPSSLEILGLEATSITDENLFQIGQRCLNIKEIRLTACKKVTRFGISVFVLYYMPKLEHIYIENSNMYPEEIEKLYIYLSIVKPLVNLHAQSM